MKLNHVFLIFALVLGCAAGAAYVAYPAFRSISIPPYFLVLIVLGLFDVACYLRGGGAPGTVISMEVRFAGFFIALVAMAVITQIAGVQLVYF